MNKEDKSVVNRVSIRTGTAIDNDDDFIEAKLRKTAFNPNTALKFGIFILLGIIVILLLVIINGSDDGNESDRLFVSGSSLQSREESMDEAVSETEKEPSEEISEVSEAEISQASAEEVSQEQSKLKMLVVDRVVDNTKENAINTLKGKGFKVIINEIYSDEVDTGKVVSQEPAYFTLLQEGGTVTLNVSLGSDPVKLKIDESIAETTEKSQISIVEQSIGNDESSNESRSESSNNGANSYEIPIINISGREKNDAENILKSQGFRVQAVYMSSPSVRKGYVIEQSPAGGVKQKYGSTVTLYVSKGLEVNVTLEANGGTVGKNKITLIYGGKYGTLPVPSRENYDFLGWYTGINGGIRADENTLVAQPYDHILYAMWKAKPISDWVLDTDAPQGARIAEMKWTYTVTKTISSELPVMENGWRQAGSYWKETASGANYYADFKSGVNAGYNQKDKYYSKYNHQFLSQFDNGSQKREVTTKFYTYLYWHWCSNITSVPPESMPIASKYEEDIFSPNGNYLGKGMIWEVFESSDEGTQSSGKYVMKIQSRYSYWWNRISVYYQTYKDYRKFYQYYKVENKESRTPVNETDEIGNIKRYVKYYLA